MTFHRNAGLLLGVVTFALLPHLFTHAAENSQAPMLRIEAGTHLGQIVGVDADSAGRFAVSASEDATARVWDVRSGRLLTVLRVPSGSGRTGRLSAVAMTPDGDTIAVAAADMEVSGLSQSVYVFERSSGRVVGRLAGLPSTLGKLAFDPGGNWLAVSLLGDGSTGGLRVWDWRKQGATAAVLASEGLKEGMFGIGWSANGRLAASSLDGQMRLYRIDKGRLVKVAQAPTPGGPFAPTVSFSPDGKELAVGYSNTVRVDILSGDDLSLRHTPIQGPTKEGFAFSSVTWSADGKTLSAGGNLGSQKIKLIRHWSNAGRGTAADFSIEGDTLQSLRSLPDGRMLVASGASLGVLSATGDWRPFRPRATADFRNTHTYFGLNRNGTDVQFTFEPFGSRFSFALTGRSVVPATSDQFVLPWTTGPVNRDMLRGIEASIVVAPVAGKIGRDLHGMALAPNAAGIALGIGDSLHYLDAAGNRLWRLRGSSHVWAVNIPPKGNIVVATLGDGTIHWHRLSDGAELLALFPHADRKRWVLWTPSGYYDASPGAEDLIGWHVNRGVSQAADFFPVSQFRERFYRPDVIDLVLETLDEGIALAKANAAAGRREAAVSVTQVLPPVVDAVSVPERFADTSLTVRIRVRAPPDAPSIRLRVLVDGEIMPSAKAARAVGTDGTEDLTLILPPKDSEVRIYADNRHGTSLPLTFTLQWVGDRKVFGAGEQGDRKTAKPKLWLLAVGVSAYRDAAVPSLNYAHLDAEVFAKTLQAQQGKAYREVAVRLLTQAAATRASVLEGLEWLKANVAAGDVGLVFLSGHGFTMATDKRYYYGASDVDLRRLVDTGVAYKDIQDALVEFNVRGGGTRALFFIDTCHAGDATGARLSGAVKASNGDAMATELSRQENQVLVFASSRGDQVSWEDPRYGHGAFTKALIEGLGEEFKADLMGQDRVTYKGLDTWVSSRVPILTQNKQTPRLMTPPGGVDDFALATK